MEYRSGGDYDGDKAWVCWESSIVDNFQNADMPKVPNLVREGWLDKVSTTYEQLIQGETDPTSTFLKRSFEFNLEQSMLGTCTVFKEEWAYKQEDLNTDKYVYICQLLSDLVDQAKSGVIFTREHWERFRKGALEGAQRSRPRYKDDFLDPKATHIIDRLKYTADFTTKKLLTEYHQSLPVATSFDADLVKLANSKRERAVQSKEWLSILKKLNKDIENVRDVWRKYWATAKRGPAEEEKPEFAQIRDECFELFCAIRPEDETTDLAHNLLETWHNNTPELSQWALLRASAAFANSPKENHRFVWWMAGRQLCQLKAMQTQLGFVPLTHEMYAMLKPDATIVKRRLWELEEKEAGFRVPEEEDEYGIEDDYFDEVVVSDD
jgi:hypothetical protein